MKETIEINGVSYEEIHRDKKRIGKKLSGLLMMAAAMGSMAYPGTNATGGDPMPRVNIVEEYRLIQQKKSKLSRKHRDWVVAEFLSRYRRVNSKP